MEILTLSTNVSVLYNYSLFLDTGKLKILHVVLLESGFGEINI